jgi:hypothetical protein
VHFDEHHIDGGEEIEGRYYIVDDLIKIKIAQKD